MADSVFKKIEIVGTSEQVLRRCDGQRGGKGGGDDVGLSWFEVVELRGAIADGKVKQYQVTIRIGCKVD